MSNAINQEVEAIRTLLTALEPLESKSRQAVLDYVMHRLDISFPAPSLIKPNVSETPPSPFPEPQQTPPQEPGHIHIKDLKDQKKPRSSNEMAALVAYYLLYKAKPNERKQTITTKDIETYFRIAEFKGPTKPQFTLPNAKAAGYLDAAGSGKYKLNPVGYNLVVHSMPRAEKQVTRKPSKRFKMKQKKVS